jgi:hypothetical protein
MSTPPMIAWLGRASTPRPPSPEPDSPMPRPAPDEVPVNPTPAEVPPRTPREVPRSRAPLRIYY